MAEAKKLGVENVPDIYLEDGTNFGANVDFLEQILIKTLKENK